jgi:hypothetical protein
MRNFTPWLIIGMAYIGPPAWAYFAIQADYSAQQSPQGFRCGSTAVVIILFACLISSILAGVALLLRAYLPIDPKPDARRRRIQRLIFVAPIVVSALFVIDLI